MCSDILTGNKWIVHDCCVNIHNNIQKWKSLTCDSYSTISKIGAMKHKEISNIDTQNLESMDSRIFEEYDQLEELSVVLQSKVQKLELYLRKMEKILIKIYTVSELSDLQMSDSSGFPSPAVCILFKTWSLSKFIAVIEEIVLMYKEEFKLKSTISKEICRLNDKSALIFFEACWKYEPYIEKCKVNMLLDGIICELDLFSEIN